ncbi:unnamed protein product, partial [Rotaria magnacalcarata]
EGLNGIPQPPQHNTLEKSNNVNFIKEFLPS